MDFLIFVITLTPVVHNKMLFLVQCVLLRYHSDVIVNANCQGMFRAFNGTFLVNFESGLPITPRTQFGTYRAKEM